MKTGYKQTEVGVIPEDWEVKKLGELAEFITSGSRGWAQFYSESGALFIRSQNVRDGRLDFSDFQYVAPPEGAEGNRTKISLNDVLITITGNSVGNVAVVETALDEAYISQHVGLVRLKIPSMGAYICRYLSPNSPGNAQIAGSQSGQSKPGLNLQNLRDFRIALHPNLSEQRAIAGALSEVDALLGAQEALLAKKRDLKQAAMQQLLTGQKRLPSFTGEWQVKRLGEVAKIQRGASPRPIDSPIWFDDSSTIGWVRISDVTRSGMFLLETTQRLSPIGVKHSRPVTRGSLIMSICATVGRPIITQIDVCIHDGFVVFENLQVDQRFLYYVLKWVEPEWSKHGQTGSQMNLNTGLINGTLISLPPLPEQTAIAAVLSDMDAEIAALEAQRDKTRTLKQGMMQELLTGRIRLV
jgi:type I restriction enzyme S subunit